MPVIAAVLARVSRFVLEARRLSKKNATQPRVASLAISSTVYGVLKRDCKMTSTHASRGLGRTVMVRPFILQRRPLLHHHRSGGHRQYHRVRHQQPRPDCVRRQRTEHTVSSAAGLWQGRAPPARQQPVSTTPVKWLGILNNSPWSHRRCGMASGVLRGGVARRRPSA